MAKYMETPEFKDESEEADWWASPEGIAAIEQGFEEGRRDGTVVRDLVARRAGLTPTTTIRLDPADIELAKAQAEQLGLKYQTYLKSIIHQALRRKAVRNKL